MAHRISRRRMLAAGAASAGFMLGTSGKDSHAYPGRTDVTDGKPFWDPGPDKNLKKDLTPGKTPVRLGGFLRIEGSPAEAVKKLRDGGYTGCVAGAQPIHGLSDSQLRELRAALKEHDVVVFEVGGYTNLIHPDVKTRRENLKNLASAIEAADKVGCPMVGTISGSRDPVDFFNVHPDNWTLETWNLLVESVRQVLKDTAGMKAAIGMEAQVTTNIDGPRAHKRLIDDVGDPRLGVNLDPTNMISLATYYHTTELLHECFDLLGENILGAHAKDTYIWPDKQTVHVQEVCPGRGVMDYETYLVRLSRMKWPRTLLPEHLPAEQYPEAAAYIRKVAARVGVKMYGD